MEERIIRLPDVGEGVAQAEIVELHAKVGDMVREETVLAAAMTDKATIEIPSPVGGKVSWIGVSVGQTVAVGSEIIKIIVEAAGESVSATALNCRQAATPMQATAATSLKSPKNSTAPDPIKRAQPSTEISPPPASQCDLQTTTSDSSIRCPAGDRPLASPAVRARARELGIDLRHVHGDGPGGRILYRNLATSCVGISSARVSANNAIEEIKIIGLRRQIAQRMQDTMRRTPHFSYIEEVDVTDLERLRESINAEKLPNRPKLTVLPFIMKSLAVALADFPQMNARFDDEAETLRRYGGVHIGIATQTSAGLMVPVVRHVEALNIWDCANEVSRLAEAARAATITRDALIGSTITITSLGAVGGLATTPVINSPEVAIVGINKIAIRPVWKTSNFEPRKIMTVSSSFDHRVIDGMDAALFIQRLRNLLEAPARVFMGV